MTTERKMKNHNCTYCKKSIVFYYREGNYFCNKKHFKLFKNNKVTKENK